MKDDLWNRCSVCGRFIALDEFSADTAKVQLGYDYNGNETRDVYHVKCDAPEKSTLAVSINHGQACKMDARNDDD